jgi:hypothetical protein
MQVARDPHTATVLNDGRVLIVGGFGSDGKAQASAELFDPANPASTTLIPGGMTSARPSHTATLLGNGKVLITGGLDDNLKALDSIELYDPAIGKFTAIGSMNTARYDHTATLLLDGTVLIAGGKNDIGELQTAEIYNPSNGTFSTLSSLMTYPHWAHTATLINTWYPQVPGGVLIAGGFSSVGATKAAEVYDPSCQCFNQNYAATMNSARAYHTATQLDDVDGTILLSGGVDENGASIGTAELYDPFLATFTPTGSMSFPRAGHSATLLTNNMVLVTGGYDASGAARNTAELYDLFSGGFSPSSLGLVTARFNQTASLLHCNQCALDGSVVISGGSDGMVRRYRALNSTRRPPFTPQDSPESRSALLLLPFRLELRWRSRHMTPSSGWVTRTRASSKHSVLRGLLLIPRF